MSQPIALRLVVEVADGECLTVPGSATAAFGLGRWVVTVAPAREDQSFLDAEAFLASYDEQDEGIYDDLVSGGHAAG